MTNENRGMNDGLEFKGIREISGNPILLADEIKIPEQVKQKK
jgi:hypothetical protein